MISIPKQIVENEIIVFKADFVSQHSVISDNLKLLKRKNSKQMSRPEIGFLNRIINEFKKNKSNILIEFDIDQIVKRVGDLPKPKLKLIIKNKIFYLKDLILIAFNYDDLRSKFYPKFYDSLGIKACVYCNSQLAVSVIKNRYPQAKKGRRSPLKSLGSEISAKYQLDHYYPKSKYPYLSASVYNLYPSCATCNNIKSSNPVNFRLYEEIPLPSIYKFYLDKKSKADYLKTNDINDLKIKFYDPDKKTEDIKSLKSFEDTFHISSIYNTQKDLVEELFYKKRVYDNAYKDVLRKSFSSIFNDINLSNRIILGNYTSESEIHKRPMSKFMQDIAEDIFFKF